MKQTITHVGATDPQCADGDDILTGFISEEEYARRRGVTMRTCQRDRQLRKAPPHVQLGRRIYYRIDAVREWLVRNERTETPVPSRPKRAGSSANRHY